MVLAVLLLPVCPSAHLWAQQVAPNRAIAYLFPTNVEDARAVWINPAGLAVRREASIYAEVAVGDPGAKGRLRQINAGFNSGGFSFGYQRDILDNGARGSTYRIGVAGGARGLAAGVDVARYEGGGTHATGWEFGGRYVAATGLVLGLVGTNVGEPIVRGLRQPLTFVPGLTWHPGQVQAIGLSADARITTDSVASYAFGLSWETGEGSASRWPLQIFARLDTDRGLRRGAFAFGFSIGGRDRGGLVATTPGDVSRIDEVSLYGVSTREAPSGRP